MASKLDFGPVKRIDQLNCFEYPVAASIKFHPQGGAIVSLDSSGHITLTATAGTTAFGWAFPPRSLEAGSTAAALGYWTSSATAGADKLLVAPFAVNPGMLFKLPCTASGGLAVQARCGETSDIVGATAGAAQYATPGTTARDLLLFVALDPDGDTNAALFTINIAKVQADT